MKIKNSILSILLISMILLSSCSFTSLAGSDLISGSSLDNDSSIYSSASVESHLEMDPNYEIVFPQDEVNEITIQITPENWQAMLDDMTENYGEQGTGAAGAAPRMPLQGGKPPLPGGDGAQRPAPGAGARAGCRAANQRGHPFSTCQGSSCCRRRSCLKHGACDGCRSAGVRNRGP